MIVCYCEALVLGEEPLGTAFMAKPPQVKQQNSSYPVDYFKRKSSNNKRINTT